MSWYQNFNFIYIEFEIDIIWTGYIAPEGTWLAVSLLDENDSKRWRVSFKLETNLGYHKEWINGVPKHFSVREVPLKVLVLLARV